MHVVHIALGGCLTYPGVRYGITEDTGGHIAYVLGAASAQARRADVAQVDIVTRAFDDSALGRDHAVAVQQIGPKLRILRISTGNPRYLSKDALAAERPALREAFHTLLAGMTDGPDVIHAHFADAVDLVRSAARLRGIPVIYTPHSLGIGKRNYVGNGVEPALNARIAEERAALQHANAVIVSSRDEAERQIEAYGVDVAARVHRISPGVDLPDSTSGTAAARSLVDPHLRHPERPMILAIARPVAKKNLGALMRAYLGHADLSNRSNLVILAGQRNSCLADTPETETVINELEASRREMPGNIVLPHHHSPEIVGQMYRLAAMRGGVFVNPALHEPFGLTLLEAARAGLPVVATNEGGPVDIVGSIGHGRLVDPRSEAAIGDAIHDLLSDGITWRTASAAGCRNIRAFDWDQWALRSLRVYTNLRPSSRPPVAPRRLVVCDIDGTLTGCRAGAAAFADWARTREIPFVVATGRSISEARNVLAEWNLPEPDVFISAVGTEIHCPSPDGRLELCMDYANYLHDGWDRQAALDAVDALGVELQPRIEQRRWKLACFGDAATARTLRLGLAAAGVGARIVASHGRLIDILPPRGGKAAATEAVAAGFGLTLAECIAAGDSGNDIDMLQACGAGILVANALPETRRLRAGSKIYRAHLPHAKGVLEGLDRLGVGAAVGQLAMGA